MTDIERLEHLRGFQAELWGMHNEIKEDADALLARIRKANEDERIARRRNRTIAIMREHSRGKTFKQLGDIHGISPGRAQQICQYGMRLNELSKL